MGLAFYGQTPTSITFLGNDVQRVYYKGNLVWQKIRPNPRTLTAHLERNGRREDTFNIRVISSATLDYSIVVEGNVGAVTINSVRATNNKGLSVSVEGNVLHLIWQKQSDYWTQAFEVYINATDHGNESTEPFTTDIRVLYSVT